MAETPARTLPITVVTTAGAASQLASGGAVSTYYIVRNIHITNETAAQITVTIGVGTSLVDANTNRHFFSAIPLAANSALDWSGFLVLLGHATTPDLLYAFASAAASATVSVSGVTGP